MTCPARRSSEKDAPRGEQHRNGAKPWGDIRVASIGLASHRLVLGDVSYRRNF